MAGKALYMSEIKELTSGRQVYYRSSLEWACVFCE